MASASLARRTALAATALAALAAVAPRSVGAQDASLLATFDTAWAAVSRTYWDTTLVKGAWRAAHDSLRPRAAAATSENQVRALVRELIAVPRQSHFVLIPRSAATTEADAAGSSDGRDVVAGSAGLELRMIGDTLVAWRVEADGPAARAGVRAGDIIAGLRGIGIDSLRQVAKAAAPRGGERERAKLINILATQLLGGNAGDTVRVRVAQDGRRLRTRDIAIVRAPLRGQATKFGNLPAMVVRSYAEPLALPGAGAPATYVTFSAWFPAIAPRLDSLLFAARGSRGVVIDLRGNPGGVVGMLAGVSGHFLDTAVSLGVMRGRGVTLRFLANPRLVDRAGLRYDVIDAPVAILVDRFTGSTSEFFASGMQALGRARVFGVPSAGEALPATMTRLPNGDVLMHVIADHEDATGRRVEGRGVQPDVVTPLVRADLRAGRDAALEAALKWLAQAQDRH